MTHVSAEVITDVLCGSNYLISLDAFANPQLIAFGDVSLGFILPSFTTSQQ